MNGSNNVVITVRIKISNPIDLFREVLALQLILKSHECRTVNTGMYGSDIIIKDEDVSMTIGVDITGTIITESKRITGGTDKGIEQAPVAARHNIGDGIHLLIQITNVVTNNNVINAVAINIASTHH